MQTPTEKSQQQCAIIHAEALVAALRKAADFPGLKSAVMTFITNMDPTFEVEDNPGVLGDRELGMLFTGYLERREKTGIGTWARLIVPRR